MIVHEDRGCCVFEYLCAGLLTGVCQTFLSIVDDELLTEGIDKMLRTTRDNKLIRVLGGEAYGVADHIAPQSTCGGDHHRVVLTDLHTFQRYDMQMIRIGDGAIRDILQGDELIEDAVIEHQHHRGIGRIVLQPEESLTGIISLHIMHRFRRDQLVVLVTIGSKGHAPMEEHFQVGPYLQQVVFTGELHHTR